MPNIFWKLIRNTACRNALASRQKINLFVDHWNLNLSMPQIEAYSLIYRLRVVSNSFSWAGDDAKLSMRGDLSVSDRYKIKLVIVMSAFYIWNTFSNLENVCAEFIQESHADICQSA